MSRNRKSIVYVISLVESSNPMFWYFRELQKHDLRFSVLFLTPSKTPLQHQLEELGISCRHFSYYSKWNIPQAFFNVWWYIIRNRPGAIHTHLFDASLVGLTAALLAGIKYRYHTRHHADQHHVFHPKAVKYDRYINRISTTIFAVSSSISDILIKQENVPTSKVKILEHGFDFASFDAVTDERVHEVRARHHVPEGKIYIGVISRYTSWKGIQYIIPAFRKVLLEHPRLHLILGNAQGDYSSEIQTILQTLPLDSFTEIVFEKDAVALMAGFDIFVHTPVDETSEAFGQVYIEALAAGIPSVFTKSGIARSFVVSEHQALVSDFKSSDSIADNISRLLLDKQLADRISFEGKFDVRNRFDIKIMVLQSLTYYGME